MTRTTRPSEGWPWEQPGYRFSIDWPPSFESAVGERDRFAEQSARSTRTREAQLALGNTGSVLGISARADALAAEYLARAKRGSKEKP